MMVSLETNVDRKVWQKYNIGGWQGSMEEWVHETERENEYVPRKICPRNESFAHGSVGARVKLMVRG